MLKLINAGIKSKRDAAARLLNGEKFYFRDKEIYFIDGSLPTPFRLGSKALSVDAWELFKKWDREVGWQEELPVLCWVWDHNNEDKTLKIISNIEDGNYKFIDEHDDGWLNAIPVKKVELDHLIK